MADIVEDIKSRLSIEDVVSQYVQLKKAGRSFKGLCPFHGEKTASFVVSTEKQICHCFGCNKGGDIFSFIQEIEGVTFAEALEILADKAGVKIDKQKLEKKHFSGEKNPYFDAHELASEFFEDRLYNSVEGKKVLEYLYRRGLTDETIKQFRLGFAPDEYDALYPKLIKKGISKEVLIKSGLATPKNIGTQDIYDKYRLRLIFPIFDQIGRICGFGGRALKKDQNPKYLNSPDTPIYNKSRILYGLSHAKKHIKGMDQAILVEGYFDMIIPFQAGFKNVVATCGTALTIEQVRLTKRFTKNIVTCFDSDDAGFEASKRAYFVFQVEDVLPKIVQFQEAKDPAEFVKDNPAGFSKMLAESTDFISFFLGKLLSFHDVKTMDGKRKVLDELLPIYKKLNPVFKDLFVRDLATKLGIGQKSLFEQLDLYKLPFDHPARQVEQGASSEAYKINIEELIISILLHHPKLFETAKFLIEEIDFHTEMKDVYKQLADQYNATRDQFETWSLKEGILASGKQKLDALALYAEEKYECFTDITLDLELRKLIDRVKKDRKIKELKVIHTKILEAETQNNLQEVKELLKQQQNLLNS